ncbi:MAG TPA: hypothetical protein VE028_10790 [Nitratidesulfovibrio sp.]|nr:hypothetical protein [Nitratidesulfovibrio sp.]
MLQEEGPQDHLVAALETLLEYEVLDHPASQGVAKQVIGDHGFDNLSEKQMHVFSEHIQPYLEIECESPHCDGSQIALEDIPSAYENQQEYGGLFCGDCQDDQQRIDEHEDSDE